VAYFGVDELSPMVSSHITAGGPVSMVEDGDPSWGFDAVRASQGHNYQHGHAYIGIADLGLNPNHPDFIDYNGTTWMGGNYHPASSFNIAEILPTTGPNANPYSGRAIMGNVDAYHLGIYTPPPDTSNLPDDDTCDLIANGGNDNGTLENVIAGHGSHVTGIIAANATNSTNVKGVCRHCPLYIAQFNYPLRVPSNQEDTFCDVGTHPDGTNMEGYTSRSVASMYASMAFMIDVGVQVINLSAGVQEVDGLTNTNVNNDFCPANSNDAWCLVLEYAQDRDVMLVASAGNYSDNELQFPAVDTRVVGVSGVINGGGLWVEDSAYGAEHGSSYGTNQTNGPSFSAPAKDVYSTMYNGKEYFPSVCDERNDGVDDDYGYCTGTSMAAPYVTAVAGLVRATNPLADIQAVLTVMEDSTTQSSYSNTLGWGTPRADYAVKDALGTSNGTQVLNRITPLFSMDSSVAGDIAQTTKPQVAMAYHLNTYWGYVPYEAESTVNGYSFPESDKNPEITEPPHADLFLLTTHKKPANGRYVTPLYRMSFIGGSTGNPDPDNADWALVLGSEISGTGSFRDLQNEPHPYEMDGIEGYVYTTCSPEPSCIPDGAVKVYRAFNAQRDDHAVFPVSKLSYMQSQGYTSGLKKLGYAYPNQDSDSDGLIDGMEYILGTDPNISDSDCDGVSDGAEYPLTSMPVSDPMDGSCVSGQPQTPWASNAGTPTSINLTWFQVAGYHFKPLVNGEITKLGGYFNGTKTVKLFNKTTGVLLATTTVSSSNSWSYSAITPVPVTAGASYTVAVYLNKSGMSREHLSAANYFPNTYDDIEITASTAVQSSSDPDIRPTNNKTHDMWGQVDVEFVAD